MDTARRTAVDPARGLRAADVAERVARGEVNRVPAAPTRTVGQIVRTNVFTRFNALLGGMLVLILIVGPLQDALFGLVLVANTLIGIVQELRAKRTLDRLTLLTAPTATVVRDGGSSRVEPSAIVRDDVVAAGRSSSPARVGCRSVSSARRPTPRGSRRMHAGSH
jgi:cation-transporting P-type ATPase E